jgi:hypothetical protein
MEKKIDVWKSSLIVGIFSCLTTAAKSALLPFLALYFRYLGLDGFQVGLVFALRALVNIVVTFLWGSCCAQIEQKHKILVMSLIAAILSNGLFMFVSPRDKQLFSAYCNKGMIISSSNDSYNSTYAYDSTFSTSNNYTTILPYVTLFSSSSVSLQSSLPSLESNQSVKDYPEFTSELPITDYAVNKSLLEAFESFENKTTDDSISYVTANVAAISTVPREVLVNMVFDILPAGKQYLESHGFTRQMLLDMPEPEFEELLRKVMELNLEDGSDNSTEVHNDQLLNVTLSPNFEDYTLDNLEHVTEFRNKRDVFANAFDGLHGSLGNLRSYVVQGGLQTFVLILLVGFASELFTSILDMHADRMWYDFLSQLDMLQKYGQTRLWSACGGIVSPLLVTSLASMARCDMSNGISHFTVYFAVFAIFSVTAVPLAFFFPRPLDTMFRERKHEGSVDCRTMCRDTSTWSLLGSLFLIGLVGACPTLFLFWIIQDQGGSEVYMGASVASAAVSEFILLLMLKWLVLRISVVTAITFCLLSLIVRLVLYSFMWSLWIAVVGELLLPVSTCLLWSSLRIHRSFNVNPYLTDRATESILRFVHQGVGFSLGGVMSGLLYTLIGPALLLQLSAFLLCVWCLPFWLLTRCKPQSDTVSYRKLSPWQQVEQEVEELEEDDWLRDALDDGP